jgi:tRNA threonylcarbamoyladenosine modification (KEOPS) complex  Pcc1 subunit
MKAEIELECKQPGLVIKSLRPDKEDLNKFDVTLEAGKNCVRLTVKAKEVSGLLAGINSYMKLIRVAIEAMEM